MDRVFDSPQRPRISGTTTGAEEGRAKNRRGAQSSTDAILAGGGVPKLSLT
jgi:hypothetical protein